MKVTLLGTGCPVVSQERFGPALWLAGGGANVLVDCGSGVTQRMAAAGYSGVELDALVLTHLHSDHIVDLFQLVLSSWHQGRSRPLDVYGPPGTDRHVTQLMELWRSELEQRVAWEQRRSTEALEVVVHELSPDEVVRLGQLEVIAVPVDHQPVEHAFGFVFGDGSHRVACSGDTRYCPALVEAAQGVDLLVHEVYSHDDMPAPGGTRTREGLDNVAAYHSSPVDVGRTAREANVGALVLTHLVPPDVDKERLLARVADEYSGTIVVGEDLLTIDLQSRIANFSTLAMRLAPAGHG
jgi:ribonuclease Z